MSRVDLAIVADVPDLETVLTAINADFIAEKVGYVNEMAQNNPRLKEKVDRIFSRAELVAFPHTESLQSSPPKRNLLCAPGRSIHGGNILLYSGVDVPKWFTKRGTIVPEYYASRMN